MLSADGRSPYDKEYFVGDQERRVAFHNEQMAERRAKLTERIRMGTMASNPMGYYDRMVKMQIRPKLIYNSTAADYPFFRNFSESWKPLDTGLSVSGGVIKDYRYAQRLLAQREQDYLNERAASEGLPPAAPESGMMLTDIESKSLELNQLLTALDGAVQVGDVNSFAVSDLKNVLRLMVGLVPALEEDRIVELIQYSDDLLTSLYDLAGEETAAATNKNARIMAKFFEDIKEFLQGMLEVVNRSPQERMIAARSLVKQIFRLKPREERELYTAMAPMAGVPTQEEEQPGAAVPAAEVQNEIAPADAQAIIDAYNQAEGPKSNPSEDLRALYVAQGGNPNSTKKNQAMRNDLVRMMRGPTPARFNYERYLEQRAGQ